MTINIPNIKLFVRNEFLFNQEKGHGEFTEGILVSARSVKNKAMTFTVLLENGVLFTGLPLHALCRDKCDSIELSIAQMWDCISYDVQCIELSLVRYSNVTVKLTDNKIVPGEYLFSIDFDHSNTMTSLSETPDEWKMMHFIVLDDGQFVLYPQNRIRWLDSSLTDVSQPIPAYKVNTIDWKAEEVKDVKKNGEWDY